MKYLKKLVLLGMASSLPFLCQSGFSSKLANTAEWELVRNKYGWQISLPRCWQRDGIKGESADESPSVLISSTKKCPPELIMNGEIQIVTPLGITKVSSITRGERGMRSTSKLDSVPERAVIESSLKEVYSYKKYGRASGDPKTPYDRLSWHLLSTCGDLNLDVSLVREISMNEAKIELKNQKLSDLERKVMRSLSCYK